MIFSLCEPKSLFFKRFYLFIYLQREGKGGEGEKHQRVKEKHQSVASHTPPTGDPACKPGMCPDQESNLPPSVCRIQPTKPNHWGLSY